LVLVAFDGLISRAKWQGNAERAPGSRRALEFGIIGQLQLVDSCGDGAIKKYPLPAAENK
jgi:hypothetical protein